MDQMQDRAFLAGAVSGVPASLYEGAGDLMALFDGDTYAAMAALLQEDSIIATLTESVAQDYAELFATYQREYERAGASGAYYAGMEMGKAAVELVSLVGAPGLKTAMTTGRIGRLATAAANSTRVDLPSGSIELRPVGAQHTTPPGYKVFQSPEGDRYYVSPEGQTYASLDDVPGSVGTDSVPGGGLILHENAGGHLIDRHVGKTDQQLIQRANGIGGQRAPSGGASSFLSISDAERYTAQVIAARQSDIEAYLANPGSRRVAVFDLDIGQPTGKWVPKGGTFPQSVTGVRVVIMPDSSLPNGYRIITGHPVSKVIN